MNLKEKNNEYIVNSYARYDSVLMRGTSATAVDTDNRELIDFGSGIGVNSLGFANENWANTVCRQVKKLQHTSNLFYNEPSILLAEELINMSHFKKVFFCNSGAEANEAALKIARKFSYDKYGTGRNKILSLNNSFHGRTIATLSLTGQDSFHKYFYPFVDCHYYSNPDIESIEKIVDDDFAAIFIELVQGEGGVNVLDYEFVKQLEKFCKKNDLLLIVDEVQTGMGRTGKMFCYEQYGIKPNIVTLAKGLGGGLPIGACLVDQRCAKVIRAGEHGTTFGGNPVVAAGALEVLKTLKSDGFLDNVNEKAKQFRDILATIPEVKSVSGIGLMIGIELPEYINAREFANKCLDNGLIVLTAKTKIRLLPPLNIHDDEINKGMRRFIKTLNEFVAKEENKEIEE